MTAINHATAQQLESFIRQIEDAEAEIAQATDNRKQLFAEVKACGFDVPTIKLILKERRKDSGDVATAVAIYETYVAALGTLSDTPLGQWALDRVSSMREARMTAEFGTVDASREALAKKTADALVTQPKPRRGKASADATDAALGA